MKKAILFIVCSLMLLTIQAQDAASVFKKMPDKYLLLIDSTKKLDLVDLYEAKLVARVKNVFNDTCELKELVDNYLLLESGNTTLEIILLPMINDSKVICTINTVCVPVCDSKISFYTIDWKPLDANAFINSVNASWFVKDGTDKSSDDFINAYLALDINMMQFHFDKDKLILSQTYTTPQYLNKEDRDKVSPFLKEEPKIYRWTHTRFE